MKNKYKELKDRQQKEFNELPVKSAFGETQFAEMMSEWGLDPKRDQGKIYSLAGTGVYYLRTDAKIIRDTLSRFDREMKAEIEADKTGEGFIKDMFIYEMDNHEFNYTRDITETMDALGLTPSDIEESESLRRGLVLAFESVTGGDNEE